MSIELFKAIVEPLQEHAELVNKGMDSEQATSIVFNHYGVDEEENQESN